ncbi:hypothetical protein EYF80_060794 [Liparis tanakae]|uniref:Secreted protein n=1 Tax=Liparis tanakae TaxID=230148 RepID=A0A4Z2EJW8_9TELE|nr:hypothetical protein EYF80_060794 [Liparis tanakae]
MRWALGRGLFSGTTAALLSWVGSRRSSRSAIRPSSSACSGVWVPMTVRSSHVTRLICLQNAGDALKSVSEPAYLIWRKTQRNVVLDLATQPGGHLEDGVVVLHHEHHQLGGQQLVQVHLLQGAQDALREHLHHLQRPAGHGTEDTGHRT